MIGDRCEVPSVVDLIVGLLVKGAGGHNGEAVVADVGSHLWVGE